MKNTTKIQIAYNLALFALGYVLYIAFAHHDLLYFKDWPFPTGYLFGGLVLYLVFKAWHYVEEKAEIVRRAT